MKKKTYEKPTMKVIKIQQRTNLLTTSSPDAPDHDDWLGYNGGNSRWA